MSLYRQLANYYGRDGGSSGTNQAYSVSFAKSDEGGRRRASAARQWWGGRRAYAQVLASNEAVCQPIRASAPDYGSPGSELCVWYRDPAVRVAGRRGDVGHTILPVVNMNDYGRGRRLLQLDRRGDVRRILGLGFQPGASGKACEYAPQRTTSRTLLGKIKPGEKIMRSSCPISSGKTLTLCRMSAKTDDDAVLW